jgi:plastocyanin
MTTRTHVGWALCGLLVAAVHAAPAQKTPAGSTPQPSAGAATTAGAVTGSVKFEGTAPKPRPVRMESDPLCVPIGKGATSETLVVGTGNGVQNVFVYVKDGLGSRTFPTPTKPVLVDQRGCRYTPHVFGVQVGQQVQLLNSDPADHNVNATAKNNKGFNLLQPKGVPRSTRMFEKPEVMIPLRCDIHPWMNSWVGVLPHPFFAVTSADGGFEIGGLPAGAYTLEAWHEQLGTQTQKITVDGRKGAVVAFTFKPRR